MRVGCGKVADTLSASLVIHFITGWLEVMLVEKTKVKPLFTILFSVKEPKKIIFHILRIPCLRKRLQTRNVDSGDRSLVIAKLLWSRFYCKELLYISQLTL
jgi:hypothetical protein